MTDFTFLEDEWPSLYETAEKALNAVYPDPRTACFYARRALELTVHWMYKHDSSLNLPYQDNLSALVHEPSFKKTAGQTIFSKARVVIKLGNLAVHSNRAIREHDSIAAVRELFHISYWLAHTYSRKGMPRSGLSFNPDDLPRTTVPKQTIDQLQKLEASLQEKDEKLSELLADKSTLDEELKRLRSEVAKAKKASSSLPDTHDYSEAETRDYFIDLLLKEAGWPLDKEQDREFEVSGMPNKKGVGYVDYVLWGDNGKPLGLVEAKRTRRSPQVGQQQAKLYADCLEKQFGQRPVIFYSNGYENWMWDDCNYPPRQVQGFYKKSELQLLIQRRSSKKLLSDAEINTSIVERYYQTRAIRRIGESFEQDHERKALIVMATGAGKTRTAIALCDVMMRCNWVKRVLFLADRVALVGQAVNAFKKHLPDSAPVNLVTEKDKEGRVFVSTYPTMMKQIEEMNNGQRRFGIGHFDLVIIDEAHRSVFKKYRAIFEYFDSFLVGLTATPKNEIERNTYSLFDLENGVPTDAYQLDEAVKDGFLVPSKAVSVPLKFQRQGINYDELSDDDKEQWESLDWDEDGEIPDRVEAQAVNKWLFNKDTVDKVLAHLMERGLKVAGGDRLGKTILFAKNQDHAEYIAERFNANYPHYKGEFARIITFKTEYAQSLIDTFSIKEKDPHIAISVDMLDTGIDVPEVVNLVFFKIVRSKTKFWQMIGRGTRLCPDLFEPGNDKKFFYIFDYCQNLDFFSQDPEATDGSISDSLSTRLFKSRLELISELDQKLEAENNSNIVIEAREIYGEAENTAEVRYSIASILHNEIASMNIDNFVVRPKRRLVEKYSKHEAWVKLSNDEISELSHDVAGLPSEKKPEVEEAKRFDILILNLQLAVLRAEPSFERLKKQVIDIAGLLQEKSSIPVIRDQMPLILDVQTDSWWEYITIPMLETLRLRLRDLVKLIEKHRRNPVYTDFEDEMGFEINVELPEFAEAEGFEKFRAKTRIFLLEHQDQAVIHKLRMNEPLNTADFEELERMLSESGLGGPEEIAHAKEISHGLGLFVRSLIGMDREAAKHSLDTFLIGKKLTANQIEFINLIINHLTEHGVMDAALLYESPFTDLTPQGPDGLFTSTQVDELIAALEQITATAIGSTLSQQTTA